MSGGDAAIVLAPGGGRRISLPDRGAAVTLKAVGRETGGRLAVLESAPAPGAPGLPMHRHRGSDEALYILEGEVTVRVGARTVNARAGSFVFVPRGTAHMFWNPGPNQARLLVTFAPAGVERFLEETAQVYAAGRPDPLTLQSIRAKYDTEMVDADPPHR